MPKSFISPDARFLSLMFEDVCGKFKEKYICSDRETRNVLDRTLLQHIGQLEAVLQNTNVRGHLDPRIRIPIVGQNSTTGQLLKRLKHQIKAVFVLSDLVYVDPLANPNEDDVITTARQILDQLYEASTPPSSTSGSGCATDTD